MATKHDPDSIVTESRMEVLMDGWTILVISTFRDGTNAGIMIYKAKHNLKELKQWLQ